MRAYVLVVPVLLVGALQLGGCTSTRSSNPSAPEPGGVYRSESAGALFEQTEAPRFALRDAVRSPGNPRAIYVAASGDGYVFSEDDGKSWRTVAVPLASVLDIVVLEGNIVVVTGIDGEGQGYILRSADSGKSWQTVLTVPVPEPTGFRGFGFGGRGEVATVVISIAPDPFNGSRLYAGTSLGNVLVGEQYAKTWHSIHNIDADAFSSNQVKFATASIIPSPHRAGELLVITTGGRLYVVEAEGTQRQLKIPEDLGAGPLITSVSQSRVVLDASFVPHFPQALVVGVNDGAVVTRDGGATWTALPLPVDTVKRFNTVVVRVSPTNSNRFLIGINDAVFRSEDGGQTWNTFSLGLPAHVITNLLINPENAASVLAVTSPLRT